MSNIFDHYFEEASRRIPADSTLLNKELPHPEYPDHNGFDPSEIGNSNDSVLPIGDTWEAEHVRKRLSGQEATSTFPRISNDERELLDGGVREVGLDAYAFYKSRRYLSSRPYPGKWGIFYLKHGVTRVKELIEMTYPGYGPSLRLAYEFLREHERFHFKFDLNALSTEAKIGQALYMPLKRAFRLHQVYQVEEALANRDAWIWAKQRRIGLGEFASDFMKLQPGAYARFDENKFDLSSELAANLLDLNLSRTARREDQALWVGTIPKELQRKSLCPEYFVSPVSLTSWINPAWKRPKVKKVIEGKSFSKLLSKRYSSMKKGWESTKNKLVENSALPSLDFKLWNRSTGHWSVRVGGSGFRAHLLPVPNSSGDWEADQFGSHKAMGHG